MRIVKVKFHRTDILSTFFNNEYIEGNPELVHSFGNDWVSFKDDIADNSEIDSRNNILLSIKEVIDNSDLIEGLESDIFINQTNAFPTILHAHVMDNNQRTICEIIEVETIGA